MRIRGRKSSADCSVSFSPSSSSYSSSITAANSSVPSQDSSNSCPFSLLEAASSRCRGLDLLVKAIHQVTAGSVVGVPYIQRRVAIRRRRRRSFMFDDFSKRRRETTEAKVSYNDNNIKIRKKKQTKIRLPTTIQDSVLRSCVRRSELAGEMGFNKDYKRFDSNVQMNGNVQPLTSTNEWQHTCYSLHSCESRLQY